MMELLSSLPKLISILNELLVHWKESKKIRSQRKVSYDNFRLDHCTVAYSGVRYLRP